MKYDDLLAFINGGPKMDMRNAELYFHTLSFNQTRLGVVNVRATSVDHYNQLQEFFNAREITTYEHFEDYGTSLIVDIPIRFQINLGDDVVD